MKNKHAIAVAMTGASGVLYGLRLLECLIKSKIKVYLMISKPAQMVIATETDLELPGRPEEMQIAFAEWYGATAGQLFVFGKEQWTAPLASGSSVPSAMVICPCTSGTLSAIANGASNNLLERAADVVLKEGRKLILVHRETPLSTIHIENMLKLSRMGVTILPANPGFYHRPKNIEGIVDFVVARILDQLEVEHTLIPRWGAEG